MLELRKLMLNTLHIWIATHHSLNVSSFADFFEFIFFFLLLGVLLYTTYVLELQSYVLY
jgi:hypothetical protein